MLCSHCSRRKSVDGVNPTFREKALKVISPRRFFRKAANFLSSTEGTGEFLEKTHSVCGINGLTFCRFESFFRMRNETKAAFPTMNKVRFWAFIITSLTLSPLPAQPSALATGTQSASLVLDRGWESPLQGNSLTMKELASLLSPFFQPNANTAPSPGTEIYQGVTYLMPLEDAKQKLAITQRLSPKTRVACPGFPKDSFYSYMVTGSFEGDYDQMHIVTDLADHVVAIQLVSTSLKKRVTHEYDDHGYHTYNFINNKVKAVNTIRINHEVQYEVGVRVKTWRTYDSRNTKLPNDLTFVRIDSEAIAMQMGSNSLSKGKIIETVRWYVPKPLAELILYCVRKNG